MMKFSYLVRPSLQIINETICGFLGSLPSPYGVWQNPILFGLAILAMLLPNPYLYIEIFMLTAVLLSTPDRWLHYLVARVICNYLIWCNLTEFLDFPVIPMAWYMAYYLLDHRLVIAGKPISFRLNYMLERFPYYIGLGLLSSLLQSYPGLQLVAMVSVLISPSVNGHNPRHPRYARWMPHHAIRYTIDINDLIEIVSIKLTTLFY